MNAQNLRPMHNVVMLIHQLIGYRKCKENHLIGLCLLLKEGKQLT